MTGDLSAARQVLRDQLQALEDIALNGRQRSQAIAKAERRGAAKLEPSTVSDWFKRGTPANDFLSLWAVVEVLLEWSGERQPKAFKPYWRIWWEGARNAPSAAAASPGTTQVKAYLNAARQAAAQPPYPGIPGEEERLPSLADVYVRQQARAQASKNLDRPGLGGTAPAGSTAGPTVPAAEVFRMGSSICLLLAGPGGGKSTLLRVHLADSAGHWLAGRPGKTIPVLVNAAALTSRDPLPTALAKAVTGDLRQAGLLDELTADFFRHPPRAGVSWQVLVDGLDEIPDTDTRGTVLRMLASAAAAAPALYRFVVATRPLPIRELDALGPDIPCFELQPFSRDDLLDYATQWFRGLDDPGRHVQMFTTLLDRSRFSTLARTPLMAFMLCQLYVRRPDRMLPRGRSGVYEAFVELLYEQNAHKAVARTHDEAVHNLTDRYQVPGDKKAADQAARQVLNHLPEIIDYLAHKRFHGSTAPTVEVLASHPRVNPGKVKEQYWRSFLSDVLRPTGLLTQHADDFEFLHQTLLEYHAARHAARADDAQPPERLRDLVHPAPDSPGYWLPSEAEWSYMGFLLDALLARDDDVAGQTRLLLDELVDRRPDWAQTVLTPLVRLGALPPDLAMGWLHSIVRTTGMTGSNVESAEAAALIDPVAGAAWLRHLAYATDQVGSVRVDAASALFQLNSEAGIDSLKYLAQATDLGGFVRVLAAQAATRVKPEVGTTLLLHLARERNLKGSDRARAAAALFRLEPEAGGHTSAIIAQDPEVGLYDRWSAAEHVAWANPQAGAPLFAFLADDTSLDTRVRVKAALTLAQLDPREAVPRLSHFADNPDLDGHLRKEAADVLFAVDEEAGIKALAVLVRDPTLDSVSRWYTAKTVARGDAQAGAAAYAFLAREPTLDGRSRMDAARAVARRDAQMGAAAFTFLAQDPSLKGSLRVDAAWAMTRADRKRGAKLLLGLGRDRTLEGHLRVTAAEAAAQVEPQAALDLLTSLWFDSHLDSYSRNLAAEAVARVEARWPHV